MTVPVKTRQPPRLVSRSIMFRATDPTDDEPGDGRTLDGYAAVFDTPSVINSWEGAFTEEITRGAFRKTLRERTPVLQFDHGRDARTGSVPIGVFQKLEEDDHGLSVLARLFDNLVVEPIRQAIEAGAITGMSFKFEIIRQEWTDVETGKTIKPGRDLWDKLWSNEDPAKIKRTIKEVRLHECGPVVFPQYRETTVGVRADEESARVADLDEPTYDDRDEDRDVEPGSPAESVQPSPEVASEPSTTEPLLPEPIRPSTSVSREGQPMTMPAQMTVEERASRQAEIRSRMGEIDTEFAGAELPEETSTEWRNLEEEYELHTRAISAAEDRRESLARVAGEDPGRIDRPNNRPTPGARTAKNIFDLSEIRSHARSVDDLPVLYRDHALRAIETSRFPGVENREVAQGQVAKLLDTIDDSSGTLARRVLATGSPVYERAFGKAVIAGKTDLLTTEERAALALGTDTSGGYAVPYMLDPSVILTSDGVISPIRGLARVVQIVGKEWQGLTSAGITVSRDNEAQEVSDDGPAFDQPVVRTTRVQGFVPFSMEIDQDWPSMRAEITMMLADAKAIEEGTSFVTGTGAGLSPGGVPGSLDYATCQVDGGGSFTSADIYAVEEDLPVRWRSRAVWMANRSIYNRIRQLGSSSDGGDLWVRLGQGLPPELIGYSAYEASAMTTTTAGTNDRLLVFGDFSQFLIVDRIGMSVELVPHLFATANNLPNGRRGIYAFWRNNSKVLVQNAFRFLANIS